MIIFHGIEITAFVRGYVHVGKIEGGSETLHIFNHIGEYDMTPGQVLERLAELETLYPPGRGGDNDEGVPRHRVRVAEHTIPQDRLG